MIISFVSNMILAHLLTPNDFGVIGMLAIFIAVSSTFVDGGLGSAIIQKKEVNDKDLSTVFLFNLTLSLVLYGILYFTAPFIAKFYRLSLLAPVLRVEGLILIINSFAVVQTALIKKRMEFEKIAYSSISAVIVSVTVSISLAYNGFGVWALVLQQLIYASFYVVVIWLCSHWKPIIVFSIESFKKMFGFGAFIFLSNIINTLGNNIQGLIIGRFFNAGMLGYYSQARKLEEIASTSISNILDQVTYPALAKKQDDNESIVLVMQKMMKFTAFVSFPIMGFLALAANVIIPLCYGNQWAQSIPYFQILCIAGLAICLQGITYNAVAAIGKSMSIFKWTVIKRSIAILLIMIGCYWGIYGLLIGSVLGAYTVLICNSIQVRHFLGYTLLRQFKDLIPIIIVTLLTCTINAMIKPYLDFSNIITLIISFLMFGVSYLILSYIFKVESLWEIKGFFYQMFNSKR